jgi:hypothetical protein
MSLTILGEFLNNMVLNWEEWHKNTIIGMMDQNQTRKSSRMS